MNCKDGSRNSKDVSRAELIKMVALLRGSMYTVLNDPCVSGRMNWEDEIGAREVLAQTVFYVDGDSFDNPEPCPRCNSKEKLIDGMVQTGVGVINNTHEAIGELVECISNHVNKKDWPRLVHQLAAQDCEVKEMQPAIFPAGEGAATWEPAKEDGKGKEEYGQPLWRGYLAAFLKRHKS